MISRFAPRAKEPPASGKKGKEPDAGGVISLDWVIERFGRAKK
jgi:hypothetical protein